MASKSENLAKHSDSLVELLAAQCTDLERLLALAKEETVAAQGGKFTRVWDIVSERNLIGQRLEAFHLQIAELRSALESQGENVGKFDVTGRVVELANLTLIQDQRTRKVLTAVRERTADEMLALERAQTGTNAYLRQPNRGLSYDKNF